MTLLLSLLEELTQGLVLLVFVFSEVVPELMQLSLGVSEPEHLVFQLLLQLLVSGSLVFHLVPMAFLEMLNLCMLPVK